MRGTGGLEFREFPCRDLGIEQLINLFEVAALKLEQAYTTKPILLLTRLSLHI
jgi:hypothetical protein